jgi:hypothetical protein
MKKTGFIISFLFFAVIFSAQTVLNYNAYLRSNFGTDTMWDGLEVPIYSINPMMSSEPKLPAPILYCSEGDSVIIYARSIAQGEHHTVHLHGLDVDTRNDGDPSTSFWLEHMQDTTYSFRATNAGTYIYHCHVADVVHVQMGMYGLIVVKAAGGTKNAWTGGPSYDRDYKWLTSELDSAWHMNVPPHNSIMDTVNIPPYLPTYFLVNGKSEQQIDTNDSIRVEGMVGEKIYMRLANIGFYYNKIVFPSSLAAQIIDSDGRPLPSAITNDTVYMAPGERFGVMLSPSVEITDSIPVEFVNMNTGLTENTQWVPLKIQDGVGVKEFSKQDMFTVFPVPARSKLFIENKKETRIDNVTINDVSGKLVFSADYSPYGIDISGFEAGVYFLQLCTPNGNYFFPLIKQ